MGGQPGPPRSSAPHLPPPQWLAPPAAPAPPFPSALPHQPAPSPPGRDRCSSPLQAVTGYGREVDRRRGREAGFHHLVKPVDLRALEGLLAAAEAAPRAPPRGRQGSQRGG